MKSFLEAQKIAQLQDLGNFAQSTILQVFSIVGFTTGPQKVPQTVINHFKIVSMVQKSVPHSVK